jgi:hypothetical protein
MHTRYIASDMMIAHDSGELRPGTWICDCMACEDVLRANPETPMVLKGGSGRYSLSAGELVRYGADVIAAAHGDYVREVWAMMPAR